MEIRYGSQWSDYEWMAVVGGLACFWSGWTIGASNLANAFGTSVGAKTLTMLQACMVGTVFEFFGALALGSAVTDTIAGSIARPSAFTDYPEIFMFGMLCSIIAAASWVSLATYLECGVSTTHSIIGAVLAFTLVWDGATAVVWADPTPTFPYYMGFVPVAVSWCIAPLASLLFAAFTFLMNRTFILRRQNSTVLAFWALPILVFKTIIIDLFCILYKGAGSKIRWSIVKCIWVSVAVAGGCSVFAAGIIMPYLWWKLKIHLKQQSRPVGRDISMLVRTEIPVEHNKAIEDRNGRFIVEDSYGDQGKGDFEGEETSLSKRDDGEASTSNKDVAVMAVMRPAGQTAVGVWESAYDQAEPTLTQEAEKNPHITEAQRLLIKMGCTVRKAVLHGVTLDIHENIDEDENIRTMHQAAEIFDPETEYVYKYLQMFSACCVSFVHGAKDSANAAGPYAAIWYVYNNSAIKATGGTPCPIWILTLAALGIVCGLNTYGYNMIRVLGVKMTKMTPSRGYSAELSVALVVAIAVYFQLPISTTHCIVLECVKALHMVPTGYCLQRPSQLGVSQSSSLVCSLLSSLPLVATHHLLFSLVKCSTTALRSRHWHRHNCNP